MKRVVIIQNQLPHYRRRFFELLRGALLANHVELTVVYSARKNDMLVVDAPEWAEYVPMIRFGKLGLLRSLQHIQGADLVIVPQEVKYLSSHIIQLRSRFSAAKFAFWGHGRNFQAKNRRSVPELLKRYISRHVDWWFAYNDTSAQVVESLGFPRDKITNVQNSTDTKNMRTMKSRLPKENLFSLRKKLGLESNNVAVYTGGLYLHKRIDFLLESAEKIRQQIPDFELLIIGDGPDRKKVELASSKNHWIHYLGKLNDEEKLPYWVIAKFLMMPGLVGLVAVDSLALGVPMVTTAYPYHSPEVDYLKDGENGVIVKDWEDTNVYAAACIRMLTDTVYRDGLIKEGESNCDKLSVEMMVGNMMNGIMRSLDWEVSKCP